MNRLPASIFVMVCMLSSLASVFANENGWPRTVPLTHGMITIYSLQPEDKTTDTIHFRAALAYRATPDSEPVFGAGWFESPVTIDSNNRTVHPDGLLLTDTRFPEGTADIQEELSNVLALQSRGWNLAFSLDELESDLKMAEAETRSVNTAPPRIIYRDHPALLISLDGEPVLREIKDSTLQAVINTPYPLIYDGGHYFLNAAKDVWYRADKATGPYQFESSPPAQIAAMVNEDESAGTAESGSEIITRANAPEIVVSTEPAELIVTDGPAAFVPLVDDLLVLQNSEDDVFMDVSSQDFFIVLAGRWYRSASLNGPWTYQPADKLPGVFANIPQDSDQADSRVYVAGTEEAREAVLDAQVPQTAAVARGQADIEVKYDGRPVYQPVDGTDLVYIENTGSTVLLANGLYYLVENGVWYVSASANGPWQVSDHRPAQVDTILPTSPVHNVKYVYVYESTPEVVYVGYTPGYTGSYIYRNTVFYGTGWYYRPWVSPYYYYPRFSTWGFNVSYNPWYGWGFGLSWGWGPFSVSYYSGGYWHRNHYWYNDHYGRWGPGRYRPRHYYRGHDQYRYSHNSHNRNRYSRNDYRGGADSRDRDDYGRRGNRNYSPTGTARNGNLYRGGSQRARVAQTHDYVPARSDRRSAPSRQANYIAASDSRQRNYAGSEKAGRHSTGPVSRSDLRMKASLRDVNSKAGRNTLLADNGGNVYRKPDRAPRRKDVVNQSGTASKTAKSRITPSQGNRAQSPSVSTSAGRSANYSSGSRKIASVQPSRPRLEKDTGVTRVSASAGKTLRQSGTKGRGNADSTRLAPANNTVVRKSAPSTKSRSTLQRSAQTGATRVQKQTGTTQGRRNQASLNRKAVTSGVRPGSAQKTTRKSTAGRSNAKKSGNRQSRKSRSKD